jgi:hypothetical protein
MVRIAIPGISLPSATKHLRFPFPFIWVLDALPFPTEIVMSGCLGLTLDNPPTSPSSSVSSVDDEEVNRRITPHWPTFNNMFLSRGFRLDTVRDVKEFYNSGGRTTHPLEIPGYLRACECSDDDALCPDPGLVGSSESSVFTVGRHAA